MEYYTGFLIPADQYPLLISPNRDSRPCSDSNKLKKLMRQKMRELSVRVKNLQKESRKLRSNSKEEYHRKRQRRSSQHECSIEQQRKRQFQGSSPRQLQQLLVRHQNQEITSDQQNRRQAKTKRMHFVEQPQTQKHHRQGSKQWEQGGRLATQERSGREEVHHHYKYTLDDDLKRENLQLKEQNRVLNQYFIVFKDKYSKNKEELQILKEENEKLQRKLGIKNLDYSSASQSVKARPAQSRRSKRTSKNTESSSGQEERTLNDDQPVPRQETETLLNRYIYRTNFQDEETQSTNVQHLQIPRLPFAEEEELIVATKKYKKRVDDSEDEAAIKTAKSRQKTARSDNFY